MAHPGPLLQSDTAEPEFPQDSRDGVSLSSLGRLLHPPLRVRLPALGSGHLDGGNAHRASGKPRPHQARAVGRRGRPRHPGWPAPGWPPGGTAATARRATVPPGDQAATATRPGPAGPHEQGHMQRTLVALEGQAVPGRLASALRNTDGRLQGVLKPHPLTH